MSTKYQISSVIQWNERREKCGRTWQRGFKILSGTRRFV